MEEDPYVRAVILTGSGRFFCAGADINELTHLNTVHAGMEFSMRGQALLNRIERCDKPVLAAINGTCVGGGLELALACHIRIAAARHVGSSGKPSSASFRIRRDPTTPRVIGPSRAAEMISPVKTSWRRTH